MPLSKDTAEEEAREGMVPCVLVDTADITAVTDIKYFPGSRRPQDENYISVIILDNGVTIFSTLYAETIAFALHKSGRDIKTSTRTSFDEMYFDCKPGVTTFLPYRLRARKLAL